MSFIYKFFYIVAIVIEIFQKFVANNFGKQRKEYRNTNEYKIIVFFVTKIDCKQRNYVQYLLTNIEYFNIQLQPIFYRIKS